MSNELERRLRAAGREPVPPPRATFTTALEERLRAGVGAGPEPSAEPAARPGGYRWYPVAAAAALAAVLGAVALTRGGAVLEVRVASATDAVVVLPNGTVETAIAGQSVPDGSRIQTGDEGRVVAGGKEIGPNREARVKGGAVNPSPTTAPPTTAPSAEPSTPTPAAEPPGSEPGPVAPPMTEPQAQPQPEPQEPPVAVTPRPKPEATPLPTKPPGTEPTPSPKPATGISLKLDARYREQTVKLAWSAYSGDDFAAYLVLRSDSPAEPQYPVDQHTTVVARITDRSTLSTFDTIAEPGARLYRVVAVDRDRSPVARSIAARPQPAM